MSTALIEMGTSNTSQSVKRSAAGAGVALAWLVWISESLTVSAGEPPTVLSEQVTAAHLARRFTVPVQASVIEPSSAETLVALHDRTGLTWEEIAQLLGVSRRTVHYWKNGAAPASARERRLNQIFEVIGDFSAAREALRGALRSSVGGRSIIEVIAMGAPPSLVHAHLSALLGPSIATAAPPPVPLDLLPPRAHDPRQVNVRSLLARGASPASDEESGGAPR